MRALRREILRRAKAEEGDSPQNKFLRNASLESE
jgi:hypothetical protein